MELRASLIIPFRRRDEQLQTLLADVGGFRDTELEVIIVEGDETPRAKEIVAKHPSVSYLFVPQHGPFNKCLLLNRALRDATGRLVLAYDVDLRPLPGVLARHLRLAHELYRIAVVAGYRLMCDPPSPGQHGSLETNQLLLTAPEDTPSAIRKQLVDGQRFGVCPVYETARLRRIGGWDERFVGWGAEDQDLLERYLGKDLVFLRSPDLAYIHVNHSPDPDWREAHFTEANREYYRAIRHGSPRPNRPVLGRSD